MTCTTKTFKALFCEKLRKINQKKAKKMMKYTLIDHISAENDSNEDYNCNIEKMKDYLILSVLNNSLQQKKKIEDQGTNHLKLIKIAQRNSHLNK